MIDYLLSMPDEATARAALPAYWRQGEGGAPGGWDGSCALPVQIIVGERPLGTDPETGTPMTAPVYAGGFWLVVSLAEPDDALFAIPYCMREADRAAAEAGLPYVLRERFTAEQLSRPWQVTPQWCGVDYSNTAS